MIDLKQIRCFMACVQTGSFSKAAELLFTTQPSVSKIIKSMEDEMNVSLFERYAKGIILTPEGKRIYSYAKKVMENLEKIETNSITRKTVQLSVSYNPSLWFADIFIDFFHEHEKEEICYQIYAAGTREILQRVQERTDDIGFIHVMKNQLPAFQYYITRNYLEFEPVLQTDVMMYGGKYFYKEKEKNQERIKLSEVRLIRSFMDEFSPENYWEMLDEYGNVLSDMDAVVTTNSDYIMKRLLQSSDLVSISGACPGNKQERENAFRFSEDEDGKVLYGYVFRRGEKISDTACAFIEFFKNNINEGNRMSDHS